MTRERRTPPDQAQARGGRVLARAGVGTSAAVTGNLPRAAVKPPREQAIYLMSIRDTRSAARPIRHPAAAVECRPASKAWCRGEIRHTRATNGAEMNKLVWIAALIALSTSCATKYQPQGFTGGYDDVQLSADTFQITAKGNGYTSPERAQQMALLRACDLTLRAGYDRFVVGSGDTQQRVAGMTATTATFIGNTTTINPSMPIMKPTGSLVIRAVKAGNPAYAGAYDANLIASQLRPRLT